MMSESFGHSWTPPLQCIVVASFRIGSSTFEIATNVAHVQIGLSSEICKRQKIFARHQKLLQKLATTENYKFKAHEKIMPKNELIIVIFSSTENQYDNILSVFNESRDGISVKNSTVEYLSPKIAHKMRISRHIVIRAKTA